METLELYEAVRDIGVAVIDDPTCAAFIADRPGVDLVMTTTVSVRCGDDLLVYDSEIALQRLRQQMDDRCRNPRRE
jgi:hypothetical protein